MRNIILIVFGLISFQNVYSQTSIDIKDNIGKNPSIEFHPAFLWKPQYLSEYFGFSYTFKEKFEISLGPTFGFPFSGGMGMGTGVNVKVISVKNVSLSLDAMYRLNSGVVRRKENMDSIYSEYLIPSSQFVSAGIAIDIEYKNLNRIRISPVYYFPLAKYEAELIIGSANESTVSSTRVRMEPSFGVHITFIFTHLWRNGG